MTREDQVRAVRRMRRLSGDYRTDEEVKREIDAVENRKLSRQEGMELLRRYELLPDGFFWPTDHGGNGIPTIVEKEDMILEIKREIGL